MNQLTEDILKKYGEEVCWSSVDNRYRIISIIADIKKHYFLYVFPVYRTFRIVGEFCPTLNLIRVYSIKDMKKMQEAAGELEELYKEPITVDLKISHPEHTSWGYV